jgi:alanyl-tRNA synthetase
MGGIEVSVKAADIRESFLSFFEARAHRRVESAPLVPRNDPTLFFTNAGMVQFKDTFVGLEKRPYDRATTCQKCLRVSGKHNDLENVGRTPRHHTFFEMLGNFSFGDYFKPDAIPFAWTWLTGVLGIPEERLWVTVHHSDDEAWDLWHRVIGVPASRIQRLGDKDNFWSMGETGPCGPCSEIHYDHGPAIDPAAEGPASESPRYVEIWNLVFMQFNRDAQGVTTPLPRPSIDTGAGLERIAAVLQGVYSNYDTDCFTPILARASEVLGVPDGRNPESDVALRVLADHARAAAFLISDGILPSNLDRGYVLRRLLRRAIRYGVKVGMRGRGPFFYEVVDAVVAHMGGAWPELVERRETLLEVVRNEEERFSGTLERGMVLLDAALERQEGARARVVDGELAFKLHDTYGFPLDLTRLVAEERGAVLDEPGYEVAMQRQRTRGRQAWKGSGSVAIDDLYRRLAAERPVRFLGYDETTSAAEIEGLLRDGAGVEALEAGEEGLLVASETPFYGEAGGQVGDTGEIRTAGGARLRVLETLRPLPEVIVHHVRVEEGVARSGEAAELDVDTAHRDRIRRNHTGTHLLHAALKKVLGRHVAQKGSLVGPDRLRFDFSHHKAMSGEDVEAVEDLVQGWILANAPVETRLMPVDEARASGAEALFGEKYGELVRVVSAGAFTRELCGGTHARRTGDLGLFRIVSESGIAAGVRRVEALTGTGASAWIRERDAILRGLGQRLHAGPAELCAQVERLDEERRRAERELDALRREIARRASEGVLERAERVGDLVVLAARLQGDPATLREEAERLRDRLGERSVVVLGCEDAGAVRLVATAGRAVAGAPVHAGRLVGEVAKRVGGGGGGRPDMAQAGGKLPEHLDEALAAVVGIVEGMARRP